MKPLPTPQPPPATAPDPSSASKHLRLSQQYARLADKTTSEISRLQKRRARAHFLVGELVLTNPEIWELIRPKLEPRLDELGSGRKAVDDYPETVAQIEALKKFLI